MSEIITQKSNGVIWLDILKGIGILLVVFGHRVNNPTYLINIIYSFHMPLFFFVSGYVNEIGGGIGFIQFIKKRSRQLMIPYFLFSLIYLAGNTLIGASVENADYFFRGVGWILWGTQNLPIGPLWLLPCLLTVELMFWFVGYFRILHDKSIYYIVIVFSFSHYLLQHYFQISTPWNFNEALYFFLFYVFGFKVRELKIDSNVSFFGILILIVGWVVCQPYSGFILFGESDILNYFLQYICAIFGVVLFSKLSILLQNNYLGTWFLFFGRNSMTIYLTHYGIFEVLRWITLKTLSPEFYNMESIIMSFIYTIITILTTIPMIYLTNAYFPAIIGKRRHI